MSAAVGSGRGWGRVSAGLLQAVLALAVNAALFTAIPALHNLFDLFGEKRETVVQERRVVAEIVRPKEEERKVERRRIRQVRTSAGRTDGQAMSMRFAPDLDAAGGSGVALETQDLEAMIFEEGETDEDIVPERVTPILYPERARDLGVQGTLEMVIVVGRDGKVESVDIVSSPHPSISAEARKTVGRWRFKPARNKGIPVRVRARQSVDFRLD